MYISECILFLDTGVLKCFGMCD